MSLFIYPVSSPNFSRMCEAREGEGTQLIAAKYQHRPRRCPTHYLCIALSWCRLKQLIHILRLRSIEPTREAHMDMHEAFNAFDSWKSR